MTDEGKINNIDSVLRMFDLKTEVSENEIAAIHANETKGLIQTMLTLGIIFPLRTDERDRSYILGPAAYDIKVYGTYNEYNRYKKNEKELSQKLIKSTLTTNSLQKWLLIGTAVFSLITVGITAADYETHEKELEVAKEELRLHKLELERPQQSQICSCDHKKSNHEDKSKNDSLRQKIK
jgi:hypothetical protein